MKRKNPQSMAFISRYRRCVLPLLVATTVGTTAVRADSPTDTWGSPNSNLLKTANWSTGSVPGQGVIGVINDSDSSNGNVLGLDVSSGTPAIGTIDLTGGADELVGTYNSKSASDDNMTLTLLGATLNNQANTVIANENSGTSLSFVNDATPSSKSANSGQLTLLLGNSSNVIQSSGNGNNIIIDVSITGANDGLAFLGGGNSSTTGGTLELGAGSSADTFGSTNTFNGGLTIGDAAGVNAGIVQVDGAKALPTSGSVTVNSNSQLLLNGSATYGGTAQTLTLNGTGSSTTVGALATASGNVSTLQTTVSLASNSSVDVQGAGKLTLSGQVTGNGQLSSVGSGTLTLSHANNYSGGTVVSAGSLVSGNGSALGTGNVAVSGGNLSSSITTTTTLGGNLTLNSGSITLNSSATPTLTLASNQAYTMNGGTLSLNYSSNTVGSIASLGGSSSFDITGGTLNLNNSLTTPAAYDQTYDLLSNFSSGSVSDLSIINYNTADYTANLSDTGVLSFTAVESVPEPSSWALASICALTMAGLVYGHRRQNSAA
jgi:fibronectin-binding autotransporter adhesin